MKISDVRLRVEGLDNRPGSPLIGEIWVDADGVGFPESGWSDFVVPLLLAWSRTALKLRRGARRGRVLFMEGPFEVELSLFSGELWLVRLLERGLQGRKVLREVLARAEPLLHSLLTSSERALAVARSTDSWSRDEDALTACITELKSQAKGG